MAKFEFQKSTKKTSRLISKTKISKPKEASWPSYNRAEEVYDCSPIAGHDHED